MGEPLPCQQALPLPVFVSDSMKVLLRQVAAFADCDQPVLFRGDTGVGKEYFSRLLHDGHHARRAGPFVAVNCGAIPEGLFESLFFGHVRGAFTGALQPHGGYFEQAQGGTLFLDEIGELPLLQQVKLLRVLEDGLVTRIGAEVPIATDVRLIAATHQNLREMARRSTFRTDLYYRIAVIELGIPNLAERGLEERVAIFLALLGVHAASVPTWLLEHVAQRSLPGNIRELRNIAERVRTVVEQFGDWDRAMLESVLGRDAVESVAETKAEHVLAELAGDRKNVLAALEFNGWRRKESAFQLGISRKTLWEKMRRHGI
jgi:DNA-binding NtrC family response regulator